MALSLTRYTIDTHYDEDAMFIFQTVAEHFGCHINEPRFFFHDSSKAKVILIGQPWDILTVEKQAKEFGVDFEREESE